MVGFEVHGVLARLQASGAGVQVDDDLDDFVCARVRVDGSWVEVRFPSHAHVRADAARILQNGLACDLSAAGHGVAIRTTGDGAIPELGIAPGSSDGEPVVWINTLESQLKTWIRLTESGAVLQAAAD